MPLGSKAAGRAEWRAALYLGMGAFLSYIMVYTTWRPAMTETAKLFMNGRSQAVRLPAAYRFEGKEVLIRRDPVTGDVVLSQKEKSWDRFLAALKEGNIPEDFLSPEERAQSVEDNRDPFEDWIE
jgi:antitoxin VapB